MSTKKKVFESAKDAALWLTYRTVTRGALKALEKGLLFLLPEEKKRKRIATDDKDE